MPLLTQRLPYDPAQFERDIKRAEEREKTRKDELSRCKNMMEEIELKKLWAIQDAPLPVYHNHVTERRSGGLGLFGLFGLF